MRAWARSSADRALHAARMDVRHKLKLTDRWTPLEYHEGQQLYYWTPVRFPVPCGCAYGTGQSSTVADQHPIAADAQRSQ